MRPMDFALVSVSLWEEEENDDGVCWPLCAHHLGGIIGCHVNTFTSHMPLDTCILGA